MRLVKYQTAGETGVGALDAENGSVCPTPWSSFEEFWAEADPQAAIAGLDLSGVKPIAVEKLLAPVVHRATVIGTGGNYADHAQEASGSIQIREPVFMPFLWSAIAGPEDPIVIPTEDTQTDYEVEFAVVIGKLARGLTEENAMDYVFGYTVVNDVSAREVMAREVFQVMLSKSPDTFVPVGPAIVSKDEITDPYNLGVATYVNGEIKQKSNTGSMTVRIPKLLSMITRTVTLHPGDIVTTGTPGGVGFFRTPPEFMAAGDTLVTEIDQIGRLTNKLVQGW